MSAAKFKSLVPPFDEFPLDDNCSICRWVFLPPVTTTEDVRFVFGSVLMMLSSDSGMKSRWIVDISGLCRSASNLADEVIAFVESATEQGFDFEINGIESLPIPVRLRIQELLSALIQTRRNSSLQR